MDFQKYYNLLENLQQNLLWDISNFDCDLIVLILLFIQISMQKVIFDTQKQDSKKMETTNQGIQRISRYMPQLYCLPEGYLSIPSPQQLFSNGGKCKNFTIISPFGRLEWVGQIDISTLEYPLSQTVLMGEREVEVYISGRSTPARGKQLNKPCRATFNTSLPFTYSYLQELCSINETELLDCNIERGNFSVLIPHFTKYSFNQLGDVEKKNRTAAQTHRRQQNEPQIVQWHKQSTVSRSNISSIGGDSLKQKKLNRLIIQEKDSQNSLSGENLITNLLNSMKKRQQNQQQTRVQQTQFKIFEAISGMIRDEQLLEDSQIVKLTTPKDISQIISTQNYYRELNGYSLMPKSNKSSPIIKGTFSSHGGIVNCNNYKMKIGSIIEGIQIPHQQANELEDSEYSFLGLALKNSAFDASSVASISLDQRYSFRIRRLFSLYSILFLGDNILEFCRDSAFNFSITRGHGSLNNDTQVRHERIKKWLAWACYEQFHGNLSKQNILSTNSLIMQSLAFRKPQLAIEHFYVDGRWDDGEFITRIQDADYRSYISTVKDVNLCQQLEMIAEENYEKLASNIHSWLIYVSFAVWYFKKNTFQQTLLKAIQLAPTGKVNKFHEETRLLQIYLAQNEKLPIKSALASSKLHSVTVDELCSYYIMSNSLGLQQLQKKAQESYHNRKNTYTFYRFQILQQLILKSPIKIEGINGLIQRDSYLEQSDKQLLLKKWATKFYNKQSSFYKNINIEKQADNLIKKGLLIDGLAKFFQIEEWDSKLMDKILSLATLPQLLAHFKRSVNCSVNAILSQRKGKFADLLLILKLGRKQILTRNQSIRIFHILQGKSYIEKYLNASVKGFIKDGVQKLILHSIVERNEFLQYLSSNSQDRQFIKKTYQHSLHMFNRMEEVIRSL